VVLRSADGSGDDETLTEAGAADSPSTWSPDGRTLVFERRKAEHGDLWALTPGAKPAPLVASRYNEVNARYSPDGCLLAYASDETGRFEIYVRTMCGTPRRAQVSTNGSPMAVWSPDGRRLYYCATTGQGATGLWVVDVLKQAPEVEVSRPRLLFSSAGLSNQFDIMPDGRRFVMIQLDSAPPPTEVNLVLNWFQQPAAAGAR
jgi:Tol biopolymer transport system component